MSDMRVQATAKDGKVEVKALINHPMETGMRKDAKTGEVIPAHFIEEVVCEHKGKVVMKAIWSGGISKNPFLSFTFTNGQPGDPVKITWLDNKGGTDTVEVQVK